MCTLVGFFYDDDLNLLCPRHCKPVVAGVIGTSENKADSDYDVMKIATILNFNDHLLCIIKSLILGHF